MKRVDEVVKSVVKENHLLLEELKYKILMLKKQRRQKNNNIKWVKWIVITIDESLFFKKYWKSRLAKVRKIHS